MMNYRFTTSGGGYDNIQSGAVILEILKAKAKPPYFSASSSGFSPAERAPVKGSPSYCYCL